jgi:sec-independent protein translocase protein TatA
MPFGLGFGETVLILLVLVLLFGPGKIPEIGGALGKGIKDFKAALNDREDDHRMFNSSAPNLPPPDATLPWGATEEYTPGGETQDGESPWSQPAEEPPPENPDAVTVDD